ncbi:formate/nitrite transporter family protein [Paraflavisolibacter sp. H34]|uniref:formate/nitrite transporter family protein n=1 Tax=Huijunlia imazamoxiresistens TaxID=3127457 RepID=UPI003015F205
MSYYAPSEIAAHFNKSAQQKDSYTTPRLLIYSLLGGAFIALGGLLALVVTGGMPGVAAANPGLNKLLFGALFPLGLIMVVVGGAQLFTSDCAVMPFGALNKGVSWMRVARIWILVYLGNFVGALLVAWLFGYETHILAADPWLTAARRIGELKTSHSFWTTFVKGVGANWLVCMAVWLAYAAKSAGSKALLLWFPVMCFVTFGFEHSIANMFFIPLSMLLGSPISLYDFLVVNLVPATLGNIVGGALLVALPYWYMFGKGGTPAGQPTVVPDLKKNGLLEQRFN